MKNLKNKIILILILIASILLILYPPKIVQSSKKEVGQTKDINTTAEDYLAIDVTKTIEELEASGSPDCESMKGASGEIGCHQYLPSTWSAYSLDVFDKVLEQTKENAYLVTVGKVRLWLEDGLTPGEIFLIWNTGHNGKCSAGINKYGVHYDSCAYVQKALKILEEVINNK